MYWGTKLGIFVIGIGLIYQLTGYFYNNPTKWDKVWNILVYLWGWVIIALNIILFVSIYPCTEKGIVGAAVALADANIVMSPLYYFHKHYKPSNSAEEFIGGFFDLVIYVFIVMTLNMFMALSAKLIFG
ncbi:hypothetical protein [Methanosarcina lacustris]|uniref:hypothetical protein n=1 Tax=Methanosarcina lacustris TaxID=170861 RepID=UPI00064F27C5|nr:hypothetical protein [Methanosarcina lacustris]